MVVKSRFLLYFSLLKFRITVNVVLTAFIGFYLGENYQRQFVPDTGLLFSFLGSTALVCAGVCCLNHVLEWKDDLEMNRTKRRPIPSGQVSVVEAALLGCFLVMVGLAWMLKEISFSLAIGAFLTGFLYLAIYTPLKKISWLNTTVGAVPGALPIMAGWYVAKGYFGLEGWVLFLMLFFWQHPHFYAIAWVCRKDYEQAGYRMITRDDPTGKKTCLHAFIHTLLLAGTSFILIFTDFRAGKIYLLGMIALNLWLIIQVGMLFWNRDVSQARKVIMVSVIYLSTMFALFFIDRQIYLGL